MLIVYNNFKNVWNFHKKINLDGGGVALFTTRDKCLLKVNNSFFLKNLADYAGAFDSSNPAGIAILTNNTFFSNVARKLSNITGAGSSIKLSGSGKTLVKSFNNRFIENWGLSRGKIYS